MTTAHDNHLEDEALAAAREIGAELGRFRGATAGSLREVENAMRSHFVAAASARMKRDGVVPTPAKLALASGLPRSAVEQAIAELDAPAEVRGPEAIHEDGLFAGLELLCSLWATDPRFVAVYGVPRHLAVRRTPDADNSLEDLAAIALPAVPFRRVLAALQDQKLISVNDAQAQLTGHTVRIGYREKHAIARYGRLVSGLMRTLRANYEGNVLAGTSTPWELTVSSDRPVARDRVGEYLELVQKYATIWFETLDIEQSTMPSVPDEFGQRYGACCYVSEESGADSKQSFGTARSAFTGRLPYMRSMVTANRLGREAYDRFRAVASMSCDSWFLNLDSQQKLLYAPPGGDGVPLKVTCFLFEVTGTAGRAGVMADIDLAERAVQARR